MEKISNFLEKFRDIKKPHYSTRELLVKSIKVETGVDISPEDISIKNLIAFLRVGSAAKSEIAMKKEKIIEAIKRAGSTETIRELR